MITDSDLDPNSYQSKILQVFGDRVFDGGIFYLYPRSLRVELSGSRPYIKMFLRAYERSKAILDFGLGDLSTINICLSFYGSGSLVSNLSVFRSLRSCGISIPKTAEIWQHRQEHVFDEDWDLIKIVICFEIEYGDIELFLWGLLANELGIRPRNICRLYLFDLHRQILFHPYDDRGMDIIGNNLTLLEQIYLKFNDWLLDYDRQIMDKYFQI
jgi:Domain of unknown function (DUF3885)